MPGTVGFAVGVFDLFHVGQLRRLRLARERCDRLVVGVLDDHSVVELAQARPFVAGAERVELVASLTCVDAAVLVELAADGRTSWPGTDVDVDVLFVGVDCDVHALTELDRITPPAGVRVETLPATADTNSAVLLATLHQAGRRIPVS